MCCDKQKTKTTMQLISVNRSTLTPFPCVNCQSEAAHPRCLDFVWRHIGVGQFLIVLDLSLLQAESMSVCSLKLWNKLTCIDKCLLHTGWHLNWYRRTFLSNRKTQTWERLFRMFRSIRRGFLDNKSTKYDFNLDCFVSLSHAIRDWNDFDNIPGPFAVHNK